MVEGGEGVEKEQRRKRDKNKIIILLQLQRQRQKQRLKLRMKDKTKTEIKDNKCEWAICDGGYKNENGECNISYLIEAGLIYCISGHQTGGRGKKPQAIER